MRSSRTSTSRPSAGRRRPRNPPTGRPSLSQAKVLKEAAEDLFWALLNSREFAFNH